MITNNAITIYHISLNAQTRLETYTRYNYDNVWLFQENGAVINKGYNESNSIQVRIPYNKNKDLNIENIAIGDILVEGALDIDIETQEDLSEYITYNITSIKNNNFGNNQHIHIGGK